PDSGRYCLGLTVQLRLATFNIRHGAVAGGRRVRPDLLAAACRDLDADVLALQEVDVGTQRAGGVDLASLVAEATGMAMVFGATLSPFRGGQYGNALLVRGALEDAEVMRLPRHWWPWGRREPRNAIVARVVVDAVHLSVAATHLSVRRWESRPQAVAVGRALSGRPAPRALIGDLNRSPAELTRLRVLSDYDLADIPPTFPSRAPVLRLDHVAVQGLTIVDHMVVATAVSDHRAVVVTCEAAAP
ncbi:MAG: endonuclease/exonuclease/phosphatase family protein, partial [Acidimicrobiales bacterium]